MEIIVCETKEEASRKAAADTGLNRKALYDAAIGKT